MRLIARLSMGCMLAVCGLSAGCAVAGYAPASVGLTTDLPMMMKLFEGEFDVCDGAKQKVKNG